MSEEGARLIRPPSNEPVTREESAEARLGLNLTQFEFATLMGVYRQTVARWESGATRVEYPRMFRWAVRAIAAAFTAPESVGRRSEESHDDRPE